MTKSSETKETNSLLNKWQDLRSVCSNNEQVTKIINHKITPCIAGCRLTKLMKRTPIKCHSCINKSIYGQGCTLSYQSKRLMSCNTTYLELRDEGGLLWPSKIMACIAGMMKSFFDYFLSSEDLLNDYLVSCPSSRIDLLAMKNVTHDMMSNYIVFKSVRT